LHLEQLLLAGKEPEEIERVIVEKMGRWAEKQGVTVKAHPSPPTSARRWIGVVGLGHGQFDHCLIMSGRDCLSNGAALLPLGKDEPASDHDPADIEYGLTIERR
jgi:hypothetical protein